jgi:hypothetical protein
MRSFRSRAALAGAIVAVAIVLGPGSAVAKILPVDSVEIVSGHPTAGHPIQVLVRFGDNFDLGDYPWENSEVAVVPADRTDANGWPLDRNDRGIAVPLRRVSKGAYRGTFIVKAPGNYVVFAWSSVYAREDRMLGVVTKRTYANPVKIRIAKPVPSNGHTVGRLRSSSGIVLDMTAVGVGILVIFGGYLNWRFVDAFTASMVGKRRAARTARRLFGSKIGGTIFLSMMGGLMVASGIVHTLR